jgi:hypothetical protein
MMSNENRLREQIAEVRGQIAEVETSDARLLVFVKEPFHRRG